MKTLLITRDLTDQSPINSILSKRIQIIGRSFIQFNLLDFTDWDKNADWVFFYSKNGVKSALANHQFLEFCKSVKVGTYGQMTADYLADLYNITPQFIGDGKRVSTLNSYLNHDPNRTLFVQGDHSLKALQSDMNFNLPYSEVITYQSQKLNHYLTTPADFLVFTSPLNVNYYTEQYDILPSQSLWAIGETTAFALRQKTNKQVNVASEPSEGAIVEEILNGLN